jgi:hypothetical protein
MGPFIYVMAIMGCGDGGMACQQVRMVETRYESLTACQQAASAQLIAHSDVDFPEIMASCRSVTNQFAAAEAPGARTR